MEDAMLVPDVENVEAVVLPVQPARPLRHQLRPSDLTVPPMRRTPLRRLTSLRRTKFAAPTKVREYVLEYRKATEAVKARSGDRCEILAAHDCDGYASPYPHHRKLRGQGGSNDPELNLLDVCWSGHDWIHRVLPRSEAERLGLITPSTHEESPYRP